MRIAIDASFVDPGRVGGAEQMVVGLVEGLAETSAPGDEIDVFTDHPWQAADLVRFRKLHGPGNRFLRATATLLPALRRYDAVLFSNYFTPPAPRTRRRPRCVTVVHDLQYLHFPENFTAQKRAWLRAAHELTLRAADATVAISDDVRSDILARYGRRWADRVHVIHNPVSWERFGAGDDAGPPPIDGPYVLGVSAQYPHKNLETLVLAFAELRRRGADDLRLVLVGQPARSLHGIPRSYSLEDAIRELGLSEAIHLTGYVEDRSLAAAYRHASAFAFPSLFEGFALPPVEALGLGLPVLTTRCASIPEATLGLATYVEDPRDASELADRLGEVLAEPDRFRPSADAVARVRETYAPATIGARYRALLAGD